MPLIFNDGQLLFDSGQVAMDLACCCNAGTCCCDNLSGTVNPPTNPPDLTVTIASSCPLMDGLTFTLVGQGPGFDCQKWQGSLNLGGCPSAPIILVFTLRCLHTSNGCSGYVMTVQPNNSACADAVHVVDQAVTLPCTCSPVSLVFDNLAAPSRKVGDMSGQCDCCAGTDTYTLTITL